MKNQRRRDPIEERIHALKLRGITSPSAYAKETARLAEQAQKWGLDPLSTPAIPNEPPYGWVRCLNCGKLVPKFRPDKKNCDSWCGMQYRKKRGSGKAWETT